MKSYMVISGNRDSTLANGASPFLASILNMPAAGIQGARPNDAWLVDGRGGPDLALHDINSWQTLYGQIAAAQPFLAFSAAPAELLDRWFANGKSCIFQKAFLAIKATRPDPSNQDCYKTFGPHWRHFLQFSKCDPEGRAENVNQADGVRSTALFWTPILLKTEDWSAKLSARNFLAYDSVALLPPWSEPPHEPYFSWENLSLRRGMRKVAGCHLHGENEPLAITIWRTIDDFAFCDVFCAGGDVWISFDAVRGTSAILRFPLGGNDCIREYQREFYGVQKSELSKVGQVVSVAVRTDFQNAATGMMLCLGSLDKVRTWPRSDVRLAPENGNAGHRLFTVFAQKFCGVGGLPNELKARFEAILGHPYRSTLYNGTLNAIIRHLVQPPSIQCDPDDNRAFWRNTILVARDLLFQEMLGNKRSPSDRLPSNWQIAGSGGKWVVTLPRPQSADEATNLEKHLDAISAALMMPAGSVIRFGGALILDDPQSLLDVALVA